MLFRAQNAWLAIQCIWPQESLRLPRTIQTALKARLPSWVVINPAAALLLLAIVPVYQDSPSRVGT